MYYTKPTALLKDVVQPRITVKSDFLKNLEAAQQARNAQHCATHKQFQYDCIDCSDTLPKGNTVSVLRQAYAKRRT